MKVLKRIFQINAQISHQKATVISIFYTNSWIKDYLSAKLKPFDLSIEQFNVLRILRGQKGKSMNLQDIHNRMIHKMSNTTRLVDKLIKKNMVERNICKENRRKVEIKITDMGLKTLLKIDPLIETAEKKVTANLTAEELTQLNNLLLKLNKS